MSPPIWHHWHNNRESCTRAERKPKHAYVRHFLPIQGHKFDCPWMNCNLKCRQKVTGRIRSPFFAANRRQSWQMQPFTATNTKINAVSLPVGSCRQTTKTSGCYTWSFLRWSASFQWHLPFTCAWNLWNLAYNLCVWKARVSPQLP